MSPSPQEEPLSEREAFENGFLHFSMALNALASPPDAQCKNYGSYNVAWELKSDVSAVSYLLQSPSSSRLSAQQRQGISGLVLALDTIPQQLLVSCTTEQGNVLAMNHESWAPLRVQALALLELLAPAIEDCNRYLQGPRA
jgi:hypothetical protein